MKTKVTFLSLLLMVVTSSAQLLVDFSNQTTPIAAGFQAYRATHETPATFTTQSYSVFGTTVSITPTWDRTTAASMQLIDRGTGNTPEAADLLRDWIGTDNRTSADPSGINPMTLSISNLPAGTYRWLSYHHDPNDQTGQFDAVVTDSNGVRTNANIDISNTALPLASVTKWITTITSDGINPVRLRFTGRSATVGGNVFFVMNGFELTFLGLASEWVNTGGGNWSDAGNWNATGVPNATDRLAIFGPSILAPSTVNVNLPVTLAALFFSSAQSYTLSGPNSITLAGPTGISVDNGSQTIAVPIAVTDGGGLTIAGNGELTLSGANTYTGPTVASIGVLNVSSMANGGSPSSVGASASDAANLVFNGTLRYVGSGHTSDRLFTLPTGTRTLDASGTGALNLNNAGPLPLSGTGARTLVLTGTNTGNNTLNAVLTDDPSFNRTTIIKNGPGKWVLGGANTSSGNVTVNEGTLSLGAGASLGTPLVITVQSNAVLDVSPAGGLTLGFLQALVGSGGVAGNITDGGSVISPGGTNVFATLTFSNSLILNAAGTVHMDLSSSTAIGGGVNDLIEVNGDLDLSSVNLLVDFRGPSLAGTYRLMNYSGNLLGTPNVTVQGLDTTRHTGVVTAAGGQVNLVISGVPASLVWFGGVNTWDVKTSQNWTNPTAAALDFYNNLDLVTFSQVGSVYSNVDLTTILRPGSVTVDAAAHYTFAGVGRLSGGMSLTKAGSGMLDLSTTNNDYTGTTTISGGILRLNHNTSLGTSAGGTIIQSGGTLDVNGYQTSADHISVAGTGAGGVGAIINTRAEQQSALRLLTLTGDTLVASDFRWDVRGLGGNSSFTGLFDLGGFTFTKLGTNRIAIVDSIATNAGNIVMIQGGMSLTRSRIEGPGYIDVGTNFVWFENSTTGVVAKPLIFAKGTLQCSGGDFLLHSFITNLSGLTIDAGGVLIVSNAISGAGGLTKIGASTARLEADNTYAGDTTISAGTLALGTNGTIGGGSVITLSAGATFDVLSQGGFNVASGKTLVGAGTVNGYLTLAGGSTLQVGTATNTGTLTVINGNVTLGGTTLMKLNAATKANDVISTTNTISLGGTLTVSVLTGTPAPGDTYKLFNAPVLNNNFSSVTLPPLGPSQIWINNLAVDGTIAVGQLELITTELPGGFLQFSWATALNGLVKLQAQTNSLAVGINTNWADYPGGTFNGVVHIPDVANPSVFFRLATQ